MLSGVPVTKSGAGRCKGTSPFRFLMKNLTPLLAAGALLLTSCAVNPVTGKREVMLVSEGQEQAIGQQSDPADRRRGRLAQPGSTHRR